MKRLVLALTLAIAATASTFAQTQPASRGKCRDKGVDVHLAAAKVGDADSMLCMGVKYSNVGNEVPQDDAQATVWFLKAADAGQASGMFFTGIAFWSGRGITQDKIEAHKWLTLSAKYGNEKQREQATSARQGLARVMTLQMMSDASKRAVEWETAFQKRKKS